MKNLEKKNTITEVILKEVKADAEMCPFKKVKVQDYLSFNPLVGKYVKKVASRFAGNFDYIIEVKKDEYVKLLGVSDLNMKLAKVKEGTSVVIYCDGFLNYSNGMKRIIAKVMAEEAG